MTRPCTPFPASLALLGVTVLVFLSTPALADRVWLTNGNYLEGEATRQADGSVAVTSMVGTITVPAEKVDRIEDHESFEQRVARYLEENEDLSAQEIYDLADQANRQGFATLARKLYERVLELDDDHEGARRALGYYLFDGRWVTETEYRILKGQVQFRGKWVDREVRDRVLEEESRRRMLVAELRTREALANQAAAQQAAPQYGSEFRWPTSTHPLRT